MKTVVTMIAALAALSTSSISPASAESGVTDNEITIGISNVQSGQSAEAGLETAVGINALFKATNATGGINGRKVKVLTCDDRYEPDQSINCFKTLTGEGVFGLTGIYGSACAAKYVPMCENQKVPVAGFYPGPHFIGEPVKHYVFTIRASYRDEMTQAVNKLWDAGMRSFAIIYQNDAFGADCLEGVRLALLAKGAQIAKASSYTRNKTDIADAVKEVKSANPEVVFLGAVYKPCAEAVKAAHASGFTPIFFMNSGSSVELFNSEVGKDAEGALFTEVVPPPTASVPLVEKYKAAMKQFYPNEKLGYCNLRGYMDAMIWREGLKKCGKNITRDNFIASLEKLNNVDIGLGKNSELKYSATDHLGLHKVFFGTFKNGQVVEFDGWKALTKKHASIESDKTNKLSSR